MISASAEESSREYMITARQQKRRSEIACQTSRRLEEEEGGASWIVKRRRIGATRVLTEADDRRLVAPGADATEMLAKQVKQQFKRSEEEPKNQAAP